MEEEGARALAPLLPGSRYLLGQESRVTLIVNSET